MGAVPHVAETDSEVMAFVESLIAHKRIPVRRKKALAAAAAREFPDHTTHVVKSVGGKKVLQRVRFLCGCAGCDR